MTLLLAFAFVALVSSVSACSCIAPRPAGEELIDSDAVFQGTVTKVELKGITNKYYEVTFDVSKRWKDSAQDESVIITSDSSAACGYNFEEGKSYLVYARESDGYLTTGLCTRTKLLSEAAEDLESLRLLDSSSPEVPIVISNDFTSSDDYTINQIYLEGDQLIMEISYGGGCKEHEFELRTTPGFTKSLPPIRGIHLYHEDNGDRCEALATQTMKFDLNELSGDYGYDEVIFDFHDADGEVTRLTYTLTQNPEPIPRPEPGIWEAIKRFFTRLFEFKMPVV